MKMYRVSEKYNFEFKYTYSQTPLYIHLIIMDSFLCPWVQPRSRADASLTAPPLFLTNCFKYTIQPCLM